MDQTDAPEPICAQARDPITPPAPAVDVQPTPSLIKIEAPRSAAIWDTIRSYGQQAKSWWARKRPLAKAAAALLSFTQATYVWAKHQFVHPPFEMHAKYTGARSWLVNFRPPKPSE